MVPDLIKTTELFLVPSSFLVAALGTADTNLHRAAVSVVVPETDCRCGLVQRQP